jgi:hypothetical protein
MAVAVPGSRRDDGDRRADGVEEVARRGGPAPVVGDLQEIDWWHAPREELRIDLLLDVPREQEAPAGHLAEQDDRHVVDARSIVRRLLGNGVRVRPQHTEVDLVNPDTVARHEPAARATALEHGAPGRVPGPRAAHARLVELCDAIPGEEERQPGHVVLVRVAEHDDVEPPVPRGNVLVQRAEEAFRVRAAVHEEPAATAAFDEDRVALANIEHDDTGHPVGSLRDRHPGSEHRDARHQRHQPRDAPTSRTIPPAFASGGTGQRVDDHARRGVDPVRRTPAEDVPNRDPDGDRGRHGEIQRGLQGCAGERQP